MKKIINYVAIILMVLGILTPQLVNAASFDEDIKAGTIIDAKTGQIIWQKNADTIVPIASMSKLVSIYIIERQLNNKELNLEDQVKISPNVARMSADKDLANVPLSEGEYYSVDQLYKAVVVESANDAMVALAEHIAGTEQKFVKLMRQVTRQMGIKDAELYNSSGLPVETRLGELENRLSPHDVAIVASKLLNKYPDVLKNAGLGSFDFEHNGIVTNVKASNKMLRNQKYQAYNIDGLKTGTGKNAGNCFTATGIIRNRRVISVVVGAKEDANRFEQTRKIFDYVNYQKEVVTLASNENKKLVNRTTVPKTYLKKSAVVWVDKGKAKDVQISLTKKPTKKKNGFYTFKVDGMLLKQINGNLKATAARTPLRSIFY